MNNTTLRTDTICAVKDVTCGEQKQHWIEFQLLDEQGEPLANLPYRAVNDASRAACMPEYAGQSDAEGMIRIEGLHPIAITLLMLAEPLAEVLQTRRLRTIRAEPPRPGLGERTPLYGAQTACFSLIEVQASAQGHAYHYLRIGQLCDGLPTFNPPLSNPTQPPAFHFPDAAFAGFTITGDGLDRRHVLEICPLRAWSLVLHHQQEYSLVNAYNLGLMSILAYSTKMPESHGSSESFFLQQCLDLSRTPRVWDDGQDWPCVTIDVPFNQRYTEALMLDTLKANPPEGNSQLFYAISATQVLVAWRGTEMALPFADLATDLTFRPVKPEVQANCDLKVECADLTPQGRVHLGFRDAYEVARRAFSKSLGRAIPDETRDKNLFICGHSLGGSLGLIHAATLKDKNPLLYTYGMPRTFTLKAMPSLSELWHFRHVNDIDTIPSVPPEAELDNYLYDLYGPLGTTLGLVWSLAQLATSPLFKYEDPFCHHGEIAAFYRATQHTTDRGSTYAAYRSKDGLDAPYHNTIASRLPKEAKLYLVPSISEVTNKQGEEEQQRFNKSLDSQSRNRFFPAHGNAKQGRMGGIGNHFMSQYQPYLHNQLLESIRPDREPLLARQVVRQQFEQQMKDHAGRIAVDEYALNRQFLDLHNQVSQALLMTWQIEGGTEALRRFDDVADPNTYFEKTFG